MLSVITSWSAKEVSIVPSMVVAENLKSSPLGSVAASVPFLE
ncbi:MAG: hypothetical protein WCD89_17065 [Anaerocolumna sp.]